MGESDYIRIVNKNLSAFKKKIAECDEEKGSFKFMGMDFYKPYAKYVVEYLEMEG